MEELLKLNLFMRKPMSRTESLMMLGLSMEEATKALIYYDQGLRWIKNIDYQDKLQDEMDKFVEYLVQRPKKKLISSLRLSKINTLPKMVK